MSKLKLFFLGAPRIELDGVELDTDRRKAIALLAYLAVTGETHTRDTLAALLWPESDQSRAYAYLRRALWELNNKLGDEWLDVTRESIHFHDGWLDVARFRALVEGCRARSAPNAQQHLEEAIALYRDDFMAGFSVRDSAPFDDWQFFQTEGLRRDLAWALECLVDRFQIEGAFDAALPYAARWLALDPLQESPHRALMRLYARLGQRAAAIQQYERCVQILDEELGVAPAPETTALYEEIRRGELAARPPAPAPQATERPAAAPTPAQPAPPVHLPAQATPFIGRHDELAELNGLLTDPDCRLLTLLGPGGSGKTRLALQTAAGATAHFTDGVYFVPLAPLSAAESLVPTVAQALRFSFAREEEPPRQQLLDYLRGKEMLLILDNYEHLLDEEGAALPLDILGTAPHVKLLTTTRARLNVRGEQVYPVLGLKTPDLALVTRWQASPDEARAFSAVQLFEQSAHRVRPDFALDAANLPAVLRICRLVQGMPLGIELAAGWVEVLEPAAIADEIERSLDFLETDLRDVPERQRSLRAIFSASWKLLTAAEGDVFPRLCIFRGGFNREAAAAIAGASLRELRGLANKSWLQYESSDRYGIHELLRQYGRESLRADEGAWQETLTAHAGYYATFAAANYRQMTGPQQKEAVTVLQEQIENVHDAWLWLLAQRRFDVLVDQLLPALFYFSAMRSSGGEISSLLERALEALPSPPESPSQRSWRAILLTATIQLFWFEASWYPARYNKILREAWSLASTPEAQEEMGFWYLMLLEHYSWTLDRQQGIAEHRRQIRKLRAENEPWLLAHALRSLGELVQEASQPAVQSRHAQEARELMREAEALFGRLGDAYQRATVLGRLAALARREQDYDEALQLTESARQLLQELGDEMGVAHLLHGLAEISVQRGQFERAFALFQEQRAIFRRLGSRTWVSESFHWESMHHARYGALEEAKRLRWRQLAVAHETEDPTRTAWGLWEMGELYRLEGRAAVARQWFEDAMELFIEIKDDLGRGFYHRGRASLAYAVGDYAEAQRHAQKYLDLMIGAGHSWSIAFAHYQLGAAATGLGQLDAAREHLLEALKLAHRLGHKDLCMWPLTALARLAAAHGDWDEAALLASFAAASPLTWHETRADANAVLEAVAHHLADVALDDASRRAESAELDTLVAEVATAAT